MDACCRADPHAWVVFGPDWGRHPSVSQHLFQELIGQDRLVWVETVGLRTPRLTPYDLRRSAQKLLDFLTGRRRSAATVPEVVVIAPMTLPFTRWRLVRRFNLWQVSRALQRQRRRLGIADFTLVVTVPSQCDYVGRLGETHSLYYCIDRYPLWPGMDAAHLERMERALTDRVDAIVVASDALAEHMRPTGKPVALITHGVELAHFQTPAAAPATDAVELVYFGLIDERLDQELLVQVAQALPSARLRLIGTVTTGVDRLRQQPNIRLEDRVEYLELPTAVRSAHAFLLPFRDSDLARSCNPLKLKEYLACGRPVISVALPEVVKFGDHLTVARTAAEFVDAARAVAEGRLRADPQRIASLLEGESWRHKAEALRRLVQSLDS